MRKMGCLLGCLQEIRRAISAIRVVLGLAGEGVVDGEDVTPIKDAPAPGPVVELTATILEVLTTDAGGSGTGSGSPERSMAISVDVAAVEDVYEPGHIDVIGVVHAGAGSFLGEIQGTHVAFASRAAFLTTLQGAVASACQGDAALRAQLVEELARLTGLEAEAINAHAADLAFGLHSGAIGQLIAGHPALGDDAFRSAEALTLPLQAPLLLRATLCFAGRSSEVRLRLRFET